jgi:hypothetical protein
MKKFFKNTLVSILLFLLTGAINAQSYNITATILKFEYECYACGKQDVYYFWPTGFFKDQSVEYEPKSNIPNGKDEDIQEVIRDLIGNKCVELNRKSSNAGFTSLSNSTFTGALSFGWLLMYKRPEVETHGVCSRNMNSTKHDINKNKEGEDYPISISISKIDFDSRVSAKRKIKEKEEAKKSAQKEFQGKFNLSFNKISEGIKKAKNNDSTGIEMAYEGVDEVINMGGGSSAIDLTKQYTNSDGFVWTFRGLFEDLALTYLYCGRFERGITEIKKLRDNYDPDGEGINTILGMAYLMNCQGGKATLIWQGIKMKSYNPCGVYDNVKNLIAAMREYQPDLKCIKMLKTTPILATLMCSK